MAALPDGWESDYDGKRWFYRYKATGAVQYHFPQHGDEYAEFFLDSGTGPLQLTQEENLALEQARQKSDSDGNSNIEGGTKTSGSTKDKKKTEENGMSATGYFDPSSFMNFSGAYNDSSYSCDDADERVTSNSHGNTNHAEGHVELPDADQQMWSPVGFVAELATQETLKCAEELAPVELDATPLVLAPISTNMAQPAAELPTHRSPVEKTPDPKHAQSVMQPVDSHPVTLASFAYPPLKADTPAMDEASLSTANQVTKPASSEENPTDRGETKFHSWQPTGSVAEEQGRTYDKTQGSLPRTSTLQNQNIELGDLGSKVVDKISGDIPSALAQPTDPRQSPSVEHSSAANIRSSFPATVQKAHHPSHHLETQTTNQECIPGTRARHESIVGAVVGHQVSRIPSVLKPGGRQDNEHLQGNQGKLELSTTPRPDAQNGMLSRHAYGGGAEVSAHDDSRPTVMRVNTLPNTSVARKPSPPVASGGPGFLLFHEIPTTSKSALDVTHPHDLPPNHLKSSHDSNSERIEKQARPTVDAPAAVVAPLNIVKRNSSNSSEVSSINPESKNSRFTLSSRASMPPGGVVSLGGSSTIQNTPSPDVGLPRPSNHAGFSQMNGVSSAIMGLQHLNITDQVDTSKPTSVAANTVAQTNMSSGNGTVATQQRPYSIQGPLPSLSSQNENLNNISTPPVQTTPPVYLNPLPSSQAGNISNMNQAPQPGMHYPGQIARSGTAQQQYQAQRPNLSGSSGTGAGRVPGPGHVQQLHGQSIASPHSILGSPTGAPSQTTASTLNTQQSASRPSLPSQGPAPSQTQILQQASYQHASPPSIAQTVSPLQSRVSSPAASIASLHISQSSTPSNAFATLQSPAPSNAGPINSTSQPHMAPVRPSSVPVPTAIHQTVNTKPPVASHPVTSSPAGMVPAKPPPTVNAPAKPYPMLPGQVTPLPSQVGSSPVSLPVQQPVQHNIAKPTINAQQPGTGQYLPHTAAHGSITQINPPSMPQGNIPQVLPSQGQAKPPQPQGFPLSQGASQVGGQQQVASPAPQQMLTHTQQATYATSQSSIPSAVGTLPLSMQYTFPPPPTGQVPQNVQSFSSSQAAAALTDAGKGMKKWAKKMLKNPAIKQTTAAIGGAVMAETMGVSPVAGAQIANNIYVNSNRPQLAHAQTAPVQVGPQYQTLQMGQQGQVVRPQSFHPQQNPQPGHPQPGRPQLGQSQPGPAQPRPPQPGHPQSGNSGQPQPGQPRPNQPQPPHSQTGPGRPQSMQAQPMRKPVGAQPLVRPPVASNPTPMHVNPQAQAQFRPNQQQQYPPMRPGMMGNWPPPPPPPPPPPMMGMGPPGMQTQAQAGADTNVAAMVGSAIGAALHQQQVQSNTQGHESSHNESYGAESHGSTHEAHAGAHEQTYESSAPPATYAESSNYMASDTTYMDSSNYTVTNNTESNYTETNNTESNYYTDTNSTEIINNVYIDNSNYSFSNSEVVDNSMYVDSSVADTTYIDYTTTDINVDVNMTLYSDGNVEAFTMDESMSMMTSNDFAVADYSGEAWGGGEF